MKIVKIVLGIDDQEVCDSTDNPLLKRLTKSLHKSTTRLARAVAAGGGSLTPSAVSGRSFHMANNVLKKLTDQVEETKTVIGSATTLIEGFSARIQAAVDKALENGATEEELAPITDEIAALDAASVQLAAAVEANTPAMTGKKKKK